MQTINIQFLPEVKFTVCPKRKINLTKFVSWNMRQPFRKRIATRERGNVAALHAP